MSHKHNLNISSSPRPARDDLEIPLDYEPDTPMHHSFRGTTPAAWRHKLVQAAQILIVFLLVAAAGVWFFIDVEDLHSSSRTGRPGMQSDESFPDGFLGVHDTTTTRLRALSRAESMGVHIDEHEEEKLRSISAKERWEGLLDNITVQPLVRTNPQPSRDSKVVLLVPPCCGALSLDEEQVAQCNLHLMNSCSGLAEVQCFLTASSQPPCNVQHPSTYSYRDSYFAGLRRAVPHLQELGWVSLQTHSDFGGDSSPKGCDKKSSAVELAEEAVRGAELVIAESSSLSRILELNPQTRVIVLDPSTSAVLSSDHLDQLQSDNVSAIWRPQTLTNDSAQNGPLFNGSAYLASAEGADEEAEFQSARSPILSSAVTNKIVAILSHAYRYRHPLDCGGNPEHMRFVGAFEQNTSHWSPPRLSERATDVAFMPQLTPGESLAGISPGAQKLMMSQRARLTKVLKDMQIAHPELNIQVTSSNSGSYVEYLQQLQTTKILITIGGMEEWSEQDFDAVFSGCLLMKVNPDSIRTYPNIFNPKKNVLEADSAWSSIAETLLDALKDQEHAQRMADRTINELLEFSDMTRYAGDIDESLLQSMQLSS